ncbi:unnamed protein product [Spirodela intermedia]|uniref:Uncharacterized protein n=1 Tax=Spirodela intermedia TaxID=51605 RepID=A0A7I8JSB3_SPIIN|nr:unnamed protein product [Spirodela intermedia]CAA6672453.1 unnamed protein product [Spirodela intermedia]
MTSCSGGSSCSVHGLEGSPWTKTTLEINEVSRRIVFGGCHPAERKNGDFAALRRLSPNREELDGGGRVSRSFILRSAQQEEALYRIWYALRRAGSC